MRLPAIFKTSVFQLTILYVVLFGVSVATLGWFIYQSTVGYMRDQTDEVIRAEIEFLAAQSGRLDTTSFIALIEARSARETDERFAYLLVDGRGRFVAGNLGSESGPLLPDVVSEWIEFRPASGDNPAPVRARILPVGNRGARILVGREIRELEQINNRFIRALTLGLGLTMLLALGGGLALALSAQRRITILNRTTRRIIEGDLSQRVPIEGAYDEHGELARSVNEMLDQIEGLMSGIRHVGDSIAHDLRGPLTRLRTRLERLAEQETPSREEVENCIAQADAVLATFNALLRISRIETGAYRSGFDVIELGPIVRDVAELYEATADDQLVELRLRVVDDAYVFGDRELLAQALTNLLDNALKHTPVGGHIDMQVHRSGDRIQIVVADSGPGIPAEARERVLQRFARLDESRSRPGNGLGLALVRAIADQHDARLALTDNAPGLRVTMSLPAATAPESQGSPKRKGPA